MISSSLEEKSFLPLVDVGARLFYSNLENPMSLMQ